MRKKEDLDFLLDKKIQLYKFNAQTQELKFIKICSANILEENTLDKEAFKAKVYFNLGYRFKTNGQSLVTISLYSFNEIQDVNFIVYEEKGQKKLWKRISNIRSKTIYLREFICLECQNDLEIKNITAQMMGRDEQIKNHLNDSNEGGFGGIFD